MPSQGKPPGWPDPRAPLQTQRHSSKEAHMLTLIQRFGRAIAMALFAACFLIEVAGCSSRDLQPSDMAAVQSQTLPAGVKQPPAPQKIYITSYNHNFVGIYNEDGTLTSEIRDGVRRPAGVAVDTYGNVYVANTGDNTVTTYNRDGSRTKPTIRTALSLGPDRRREWQDLPSGRYGASHLQPKWITDKHPPDRRSARSADISKRGGRH